MLPDLTPGMLFTIYIIQNIGAIILTVTVVTLTFVFFPRIARSIARLRARWSIPSGLRKGSEQGGPEFLLHFIKPAWRATSDLENRIYSILMTENTKYMIGTRKNTESKEHAITSTAFLVAQFFGWMEILRREAHLVGYNKLVGHYDDVRHAFGHGTEDSKFQLFYLEQREIGERMIAPQSDRDREYLTMSYSDFVDLLEGQDKPKSMSVLKRETKKLMTTLPKKRLLEIQGALVKLMFFIDKDEKWIKKKDRKILELAKDGTVYGKEQLS